MQWKSKFLFKAKLTNPTFEPNADSSSFIHFYISLGMVASAHTTNTFKPVKRTVLSGRQHNRLVSSRKKQTYT